MQAVVSPDEDFFSVFGDKECLCLARFSAVVSGRIESDRAGPKVRAFVTAVETFFLTAFDVRADAAVADRGIRTAVVVGSAGAAPLPEEAVITRKATVRDRVHAFASDRDQVGFELSAALDSGAVIPVLGIKRVALQRIARKILALAAEGFALGDRAHRDIAVAVKRLALSRDAAAAIAGLLEIASITIEAAIGGDDGLFHRALSFSCPGALGRRTRSIGEVNCCFHHSIIRGSAGLYLPFSGAVRPCEKRCRRGGNIYNTGRFSSGILRLIRRTDWPTGADIDEGFFQRQLRDPRVKKDVYTLFISTCSSCPDSV